MSTERSVSVKEVTNGFIVTLTETTSMPSPSPTPISNVEPAIAVALTIKQIADIAYDFFKDGTLPERNDRDRPHVDNTLPEAPPKVDNTLPGTPGTPTQPITPPPAPTQPTTPPPAPTPTKK